MEDAIFKTALAAVTSGDYCESDVKIIKEKKNYAIGIIDKLIEPSIYRKPLDCKVAYKCGGCDFRYIDYDYQLILKKQLLDNIFKNRIVHEIMKNGINDNLFNMI